MGSEPPERLLGLRSSSERDRLMGRVCIGFDMEGVEGWRACCERDMEGSLDHDGTGGRVRLGERASFLDWCCCWEGVAGAAKGAWADSHSVDCWIL